MFFIQTLTSGPFDTNAYVVSDGAASAIIDVPPGSAEELMQAEGVEAILLTHSHFDHIGDLAAVQAGLRAPVYVHGEDRENVERPGSDGLPELVKVVGTAVDHEYGEGDVVKVGTLRFEVIHTPGHTPGGVCLYLREQGVLFSGDTLFKGSIGNLAFATAEPERMWESLRKLEGLPKETRVYPGHGEATTLGEEAWLPRAQEIFG